MLSSTELLCIKGNITVAAGVAAKTFLAKQKGGYDGDFSDAQLKIIDYWILDSWNQNEDGTTDGYDNYITQAEFDQFIGFVRSYAACSS